MMAMMSEIMTMRLLLFFSTSCSSVVVELWSAVCFAAVLLPAVHKKLELAVHSAL